MLARISTGRAALCHPCCSSYPKPLAGVVCFSGWPTLKENFISRVSGGANAKTRAFVGHGTQDQTVLPECGAKAQELLREAGVPSSLHTYPVAHSTHPSQMKDLKNWLNEQLGL